MVIVPRVDGGIHFFRRSLMQNSDGFRGRGIESVERATCDELNLGDMNILWLE